MTVTASELRQNIYRLLDEVIETGTPLEIERKGHLLRIVPADGLPKLARCSTNPGYIVGDPDDLVHMDWSEEWTP
jgi:antitoxin (DNA-binding transcriptional repressor) of toxin-antitoxin stability system